MFFNLKNQFKEEEQKQKEKVSNVPKVKPLEWKTSSNLYQQVTQKQNHNYGNYQQFFQSQFNKKMKFTFASHGHELTFEMKLNKIEQCNICNCDVLRYYWNCSKCKFIICLNCSTEVDSFKDFYDSLIKPQFCFYENTPSGESRFVFIKHIVKPKEVCYTCRYPIQLYSWSNLKLNIHACLNCTNSYFSVMPVDPLMYKQRMQQFTSGQHERENEVDL